MILTKLELTNFRQFKGHQVIEFSKDPERNITLILGNNTSGKTTLLQSFLWLFYGKANFKTKEALLNSEVEAQALRDYKDVEVKVSIEFSHKEKDYRITRSLLHSVKGNLIKPSTVSTLKMTFKHKDGLTQTVPEYSISKHIEEIIPQDLSSYFFYDTERFGNVTTKNDVAKSVKSILGLTVLENFIEHLGSESKKNTVIGKFYSSLNLSGGNTLNGNTQKMHELSEKIDNLKRQMTLIEKEINTFQQQKFEKEEMLRSLKDTIELQKIKDNLEKKLDQEYIKLENYKTSFKAAFNSNQINYLSNSLMKKALKFLENADVSDKGIKDMNANSIEDIISRGKCICGETIQLGDKKHQHLLEEMRYLPPESLGNIIKHFKNNTMLRIETSERYLPDLENNYEKILLAIQNINEITQKVTDIDSQILDKDSAKTTKQQLIQIENSLGNKIKERDTKLSLTGEYTKEIKLLRDENEKLIGIDDHNVKMLTYLEYANELLSWVRDRYSSKAADLRSNLEERVNRYFNQIYHGNRKVQIDERYKVTLITTATNQDLVTDESQGLETVKNFAFITGLVDLAKEKINEENSERDEEEYPLVLDAPFSNADETHVKNISRVLPNVVSQLVLVVMAKDWNYAAQSMDNKVGRKYILDKKSEIVTHVRGVGELNDN